MENTFDIILVSWNRLEYLKRTVASLIASGAFRDCERFIIVDNHSTDEGMKEFLDDMTQLRKTFVIRRPQNDGWGMAVNDALGLSRAQNLFVSNNDVEYSIGFHQKLLEILEEKSIILPATREVHTARGWGIVGVWRHTAHGYVAPAQGGIETALFKEMDNVPAVGWMMPKSSMQVVGMLPENGPCFTKGGNGEDTGYVNRMKECGFLVGVTAEDVAMHIDGY